MAGMTVSPYNGGRMRGTTLQVNSPCTLFIWISVTHVIIVLWVVLLGIGVALFYNGNEPAFEVRSIFNKGQYSTKANIQQRPIFYKLS